MNAIQLENGNIVHVVTLDTDTSFGEFFGVYRTLNLAISDIKAWFKSINEEEKECEENEENRCHWEMIATSQCTQTWKCKNFGDIKTVNFSRYGL